MNANRTCSASVRFIYLQLVLVELGVLGLGPLLGLGVEGVPESVIGVVLEGDAGRGVPLGVLLGEALLGVGLDLEDLALAQLDDEDVVRLALAVVVGVVVVVPRGHGHDARVGGLEVGRGHVAGLVVVALHVEGELDGAVGAEVGAGAVPGVLHGADGLVGGEGDEAEAVGDELVGNDGGVGLELDPVDGHDRRLGDHDAADRVGRGQVGVLDLELDQLVAQLCKEKSKIKLKYDVLQFG